jgi:biopolymer transport protein ExbD
MLQIHQSETPHFQITRRVRTGAFKLRLTPMIDMFTILLVFLLKSYSAEGQIVTITEDLKLPESISQAPPRVTSVISITSKWILLDGRPVQQIEPVMENERMVVDKLYDELLNLRTLTEGIGEISSSLRGFQGTIAIQSDREIPFRLVKKIMITCGQVGYNDMLLTVLQKD